jgi:DNA-binding response OmpR family regulator
MARILVIDDEPEILRFVRRALDGEGHEVDVTTDGAEGLRRALETPPDLLVLDLLMPGIDGTTVLCALVAQRPDIRIVVLSAAADTGRRVDCLELGAVDVLAKPFAVRELVARVGARLREHPAGSEPGTVTSGDLVLDLRRRVLAIDGRSVTLSQREFLLMAHLMRKAGAVCSREELLNEVWGYAFDPGSNVVDVYVRRLRNKLQNDQIRTVRNVGYELQTG